MRRIPSRRPTGSAVDSLLLASVKIVSLGSTMANTMILSHSLSLTDYGTYAQGVLLVTICSDSTILGMADAVNYFFNRGGQRRLSRAYVRAIVMIQAVVGVVTALAMLIAQGAIGDYFNNPLLPPLIVLLMARPMLTNMTSVFQVLIVSIGQARVIAIRNLVLAALKFIAVLITATITSDLAILFAMLLALDAVSLLWFWDSFRRWQYPVWPSLPSRRRIRQILGLALPMGVYVLTATFMRQIGALVIGMNEPTERYAVYSNASMVLPLDLISASFLTVIVPIVTRYIGADQKERIRDLFRHYLAVGYLTTGTFAVACLVVAPEVVQVLYGARYLDGLAVFCLYLVTAMVRFASLSLILSAAGRTRALMVVSLAAVAANAVLCPLLYALIGFIGPAVASVVVNAAMTWALLRLSLKEIGGSLRSAFDPPDLGIYALSALAAAAAGAGARWALVSGGAPAPVTAVIVFTAVTAAVLALNRRSLIGSLRAINAMK